MRSSFSAFCKKVIGDAGLGILTLLVIIGFTTVLGTMTATRSEAQVTQFLEYVGKRAGIKTISVGTSWTTYTPADFSTFAGDTAPSSGCVFTHVKVANTDADDKIYVLMTSPGVRPITDGDEVQALRTEAYGTYGPNVRTIAVAGSAAATTGKIVVTLQCAGG